MTTPGVYVVAPLAGDGGRIGYSSDGVAWFESGVLSAGASFYCVLGDSSYWLVCGTNQYFKSQDGTTWTAFTPGITSTALPRAVFKFLTLYCIAGSQAVGVDKLFRASADLTTWSDPATANAGFGTAANGGIFSMATDGTTLVCAGRKDNTNINSAQVTYSTDGSNFTACTIPASHDNSMQAVIYVATLSIWVCGGSTTTGGFWSSADGITWTQRTTPWSPAGNSCNGLAWSPTAAVIVAVGDLGKIATSTNGTSWTSRTGAHGTDNIETVLWAPALSLFIAAGINGGKVSTSPNGTTWTLRSPGWAGGATGVYGLDYSKLPAPVANFTRTPTSGAIPLTVTFTDTSTLLPTSWLWTFGDGATSTSQNPTHAYTRGGEYTVTLTATNAIGSNTKTVYSCVYVGTQQRTLLDALTLNASAILRLGSNHHAIVNPDTRRIVTSTVAAGGISSAASDVLPSEPWALVSLSGKLWTVTERGFLRRYTIADPPVFVDSLNIYAVTNRWLTSAGNFVIAPGRSGIVAVNASLAVVDQVDGLSGITLAIGQAGYVYCFNGRGIGHVIAVNASTGALSYWGTFAATNCQGMLNGYITASSLVVGVVARSAVVVFDLTDPQNPTVSTRTTNDSDLMRAVLNNASETALTDSQPSYFSDLSRWMIPTCGTATGALTAIAFGHSARVSFSALAIPEA